MSTFAERLSKAMAIRGVKKATLAKRIGVTPQRLSQLEGTTGELSVGPFVKAVRTLKIRPEWLALEEGDMELSATSVDELSSDEQSLLELWRYLSPQQVEEWLQNLHAARAANIAVAKHIQDIKWRHASNQDVEAAFGRVPAPITKKHRSPK